MDVIKFSDSCRKEQYEKDSIQLVHMRGVRSHALCLYGNGRQRFFDFYADDTGSIQSYKHAGFLVYNDKKSRLLLRDVFRRLLLRQARIPRGHYARNTVCGSGLYRIQHKPHIHNVLHKYGGHGACILFRHDDSGGHSHEQVVC